MGRIKPHKVKATPDATRKMLKAAQSQQAKAANQQLQRKK